MGYGDIRFYACAFLVAEIVCMVACLLDGRLRGKLFSHPLMFQLGVLLLTATALYGSDSNKGGGGGDKPPPGVEKDRTVIWVVKTDQGEFKVFQIRTNKDGSAVTNDLNVKVVQP